MAGLPRGEDAERRGLAVAAALRLILPLMKRTSGKAPSLSGVASAARALTVLSAFRKGDHAVSLAELSARSGLVKSTIMRLAVTLEAQGYLARLPDGSYRLEAELLRLGTIYQQSFPMEAHVTPVLEQLVAATGESAAFYVRRGDRRLCLLRVDSPHRLRLHVRAGDLLPMDGSAIARVLQLYGSEPWAPEAATTTLPIYSTGANDPHVAGLAVPVFDAAGLAGALAVTGPITRLSHGAAREASTLLCAAAQGLSRLLGGQPLA